MELQEAYEDGFDQEYDHDSIVLLDRFAWMLDDDQPAVLGAERIAAMLDGAADALHALAQARRNDLPAPRTPADGVTSGGLAVMEDDTVLCADCLHELRAEQACETAATAVHAWLADPAGQACGCCGATDSQTGS